MMTKAERDRIEGLAVRAAMETLTAAHRNGGVTPHAIALAVGRAIAEVEADRERRLLRAMRSVDWASVPRPAPQQGGKP